MVRRPWSFRADLDCVVVAPDGRVAASTIGLARAIGSGEELGVWLEVVECHRPVPRPRHCSLAVSTRLRHGGCRSRGAAAASEGCRISTAIRRRSPPGTFDPKRSRDSKCEGIVPCGWVSSASWRTNVSIPLRRPPPDLARSPERLAAGWRWATFVVRRPTARPSRGRSRPLRTASARGRSGHTRRRPRRAG